MQRVWNALHGMKAALIMVVVQTAFAGVNVFYKLAANDGMSLRVIVAYRFLFATAFMVPVALLFERYTSSVHPEPFLPSSITYDHLTLHCRSSLPDSITHLMIVSNQ